MFLNGCMARLQIVIADFEESNKKKVGGEETTGKVNRKMVKGEGSKGENIVCCASP
jgi:hypothetical protein